MADTAPLPNILPVTFPPKFPDVPPTAPDPPPFPDNLIFTLSTDADPSRPRGEIVGVREERGDPGDMVGEKAAVKADVWS